MPSRCFVINEWLLYDLLGENGTKNQEEAFNFLRKLKQKCDRIAFLENSPWADKAYRLMRCNDEKRRRISRFFHQSILLDSKKCEKLSESDIKTLPDDVMALVPPEDVYLVQTYYSTDANVLVTTDDKLRDNLSDIEKIVLEKREDFLRKYFAENDYSND